MSDTLRENNQYHGKLMAKQRILATIGFLIMNTIDNVANQATMVALAETLTSYEWIFMEISETTAYTLAGVFYNIGKLLLIVPLSRLSDKIGRKKTLLICLSFSFVSLIIIYFANSVEIVYLGRLIFGANSLIGVVTALIDDYYSVETRSKPLGYMSASMLLGFLIGSLFGPVIFVIFENRTSYLFLDGLVIVSFISIIIFVRDHPDWSNKGQRKLSTSEKEILRHTLNDPRFIGSMIINFLANMTFLGSGIYWNFIILTYFNKSGFNAGLWFLPPILGDFLTYILVPILFKKRMKQVIIYACLAGIPASIILFLKMDIVLFTVAGIVFGMLNSAVIIANDTISLDFVPSEIKGTAIGILKFFTIGAATEGPFSFGLLADFLGTFVPLSFFVIMLVIVGISYWFLVYRYINPRKNKMIDVK